MNYLEIINKINLQCDIGEKIINLIDKNRDEYFQDALNLTLYDKAEETLSNLYEKYSDDVENLNILAIYVLSMELIYDKYKKIDICEKVFIDTMKCFTRFIDECNEKNGKHYFDRAFWTYRQTCMKIFRIGELEYELVSENNEHKISIHIPSDAVLTKENIQKSITEMTEFVSKYFPEYVNKEVYCCSWLMSPKLKNILPQSSRILVFQEFFEIISYKDDAMDIFEWVFKTNKETKIADLSRKTSLQRNIIKLLENGENVGIAKGILKKNGF